MFTDIFITGFTMTTKRSSGRNVRRILNQPDTKGIKEGSRALTLKGTRSPTGRPHGTGTKERWKPRTERFAALMRHVLEIVCAEHAAQELRRKTQPNRRFRTLTPRGRESTRSAEICRAKFMLYTKVLEQEVENEERTICSLRDNLQKQIVQNEQIAMRIAQLEAKAEEKEGAMPEPPVQEENPQILTISEEPGSSNRAMSEVSSLPDIAMGLQNMRILEPLPPHDVQDKAQVFVKNNNPEEIDMGVAAFPYTPDPHDWALNMDWSHTTPDCVAAPEILDDFELEAVRATEPNCQKRNVDQQGNFYSHDEENHEMLYELCKLPESIISPMSITSSSTILDDHPMIAENFLKTD